MVAVLDLLGDGQQIGVRDALAAVAEPFHPGDDLAELLVGDVDTVFGQGGLRTLWPQQNPPCQASGRISRPAASQRLTLSSAVSGFGMV